MNKIKFEPYGDLVDQVFSKFNENSISNQNPYSQTENDETSGAEYPHGMIQKTRKKFFLQFPIFYNKYYQIMKLHK